MKLYKFRSLGSCLDLDRIEDIINNGFYCNDFLGFNDMNEGIYTHLGETPIPLSEKQNFKICSFSGEHALRCELMWGHYANAGKGVAIEVELDNSNKNNIIQVKYHHKNPNFNGSNEKNLEEILSNKSPIWCYEDEYRYLSTNQLEDNKVKIGITKIILGTPYESLSNYNDIKQNHTALKEYHKYRDKLKSICGDFGIKIAYEDMKFDKMDFRYCF